MSTQQKTSRTSIKSRQVLYLLLCVLSLSILSSCSFLQGYVPRKDQGNSIEKQDMDKLSVGLSRTQVRSLFGPPLAQSLYSNNPWVYVFYSNEKTVHEKKVNHLRVFFDDENFVSSWEEAKGFKPEFVR